MTGSTEAHREVGNKREELSHGWDMQTELSVATVQGLPLVSGYSLQFQMENGGIGEEMLSHLLKVAPVPSPCRLSAN